MKNAPLLVYKSIIILSILFFCFQILYVIDVSPIWNGFWDHHDYIYQSRNSILSKHFFAPVSSKWFTSRPFTIPLLYKIIGHDPIKMFYFQKFIYCCSVCIFVVTLNKFFSGIVFKLLNHFVMLFFFTWWNIVGWSNNLLSESLAFSFFLIWLTALIYYYRNQNVASVLFLIVSTMLLSFTRDSWPYILMIFFICNLIIYLFKKRKLLIYNSLFCVLGLLILVAQSYMVKIGNRTKLPVFNSIALRVAQSNDYLEWFKCNGMPQSEQLIKDFRGFDVSTNRVFIYSRYSDSTYVDLHHWIDKYGKGMYQKFLLEHPHYFLLLDESEKNLSRIFAYNFKEYYQGAFKFFANANNVFPIFNPWFALVSFLVCLWFWVKKKKLVFLLPLLFIFLGVVNVFINYNADAMEVERHLYLTRIICELTCVLTAYLMMYIAFLYYRKLRRQKARISDRF